MTRVSPQRRSAFTLMEMVVSVGVMSIISTVIVSGLAMIAKVAPTRGSLSESYLDASVVLSQMCSELEVATNINDATATMIDFDVDHNGVGRTIRYEWTGTGPGAPGDLVRTFDGTAPVTVLADLEEFSFAFATRSDAGPTTPPSNEGPETQIISLDGANTGPAITMGASNNSRYGQIINHGWDALYSAWRVTRVRIHVSPDKQTKGTLSIALTGTTGNGKPANSAIDEILVAESSLPTNDWHEVVFTADHRLSTPADYAIVISGSGGGSAGAVTLGSPSSSPEVYYEDTGGGTFARDDTRDLWIEVWAVPWSDTPIVTNPPSGVLTAVTITARGAGGARRNLQSSANILNEPDVSSLTLP